MNEQEFVKSIEEAKSIEEVWEVASKAGMDKASFDAMVKSMQNQQSDEISETDLEKVSGGGGAWSALRIAFGPVGLKILAESIKRLTLILKK